MKTFVKFIIAIAFLVAAPNAWAQTSAKDIVFSELEKRIIGEHFGVNVGDMVQDAGAPEWATKADEDEREDDAKDDAEDDEDRGDKDKKGKGKKDKGKGKDKAKGKSKGLPPGLAKRDELPPGLQRQLDKNGRLPAGLAKRDLPADLGVKLPKRADSQDVTIVDNDVVLVDKTTGIILDVLKDVVTNGGATTVPTPSPDGSIAPPPSQDKPGALKSILDSIFGN